MSLNDEYNKKFKEAQERVLHLKPCKICNKPPAILYRGNMIELCCAKCDVHTGLYHTIHPCTTFEVGIMNADTVIGMVDEWNEKNKS